MRDQRKPRTQYYFSIRVTHSADGKAREVLIATQEGEPLPLWAIEMSAEYLTHLAATRSPSGYEATLDTIRANAMNFRHADLEGLAPDESAERP